MRQPPPATRSAHNSPRLPVSDTGVHAYFLGTITARPSPPSSLRRYCFCHQCFASGQCTFVEPGWAQAAAVRNASTGKSGSRARCSVRDARAHPQLLPRSLFLLDRQSPLRTPTRPVTLRKSRTRSENFSPCHSALFTSSSYERTRWMAPPDWRLQEKNRTTLWVSPQEQGKRSPAWQKQQVPAAKQASNLTGTSSTTVENGSKRKLQEHYCLGGRQWFIWTLPPKHTKKITTQFFRVSFGANHGRARHIQEEAGTALPPLFFFFPFWKAVSKWNFSPTQSESLSNRWHLDINPELW